MLNTVNEFILRVGTLGMLPWHLSPLVHAYIVTGWTLLVVISVPIAFSVGKLHFLTLGWVLPGSIAFSGAVSALVAQILVGEIDRTYLAKGFAGTMAMCTVYAIVALILMILVMSLYNHRN